MNKIYLSKPHLSGKELEMLQKALDSNWITSMGPMLDTFERKVRSYLGDQKEVVALNSGTSALHLALLAAGVEENDEVVCPSFTFVATVNAIRYCKATPVFVDSEQETWNICPNLLEKALKDIIKKGKKPKAIIVVHNYGMPAKMDEIIRLSKKYQIPLIEDAACALGSTYSKSYCGTLSDYGIFSFNGNKIITTSAGGVLLCASEEEKRNIIYLATQAKDASDASQHSSVGFNYRMSNVLAAIGSSQMEVLDARIAGRRAIYERYYKVFSKRKEIDFLTEPEGCFSNRWLSCLLLENENMRNDLLQALETANIESRPLWKPMHTQPIFKEFPSYVNGISEGLNRRGICLPSSSNLTKEEFEYIVQVIQKTMEISDDK